MKKTIALVASSAVLTLGLAGCGSGPTCPRPVKQADGSYTVAAMSKKCEKKLKDYAKTKKTNTGGKIVNSK